MAFSATDAAFEGFRLTREKPLAVVGWAVFYVVATALAGALLLMVAGPGALASIKTEPTTPAEAVEALTTLVPLAAVGGLAWLVIGSVAKAAVYRAVLRPQDSRFAYLRFGADELRLMLVTLVLALVGAVLLGVLVAVAGVADGVAGPAAAGVVGAIGFVVIVALGVVWSVRLSLAAAMTFAQKRVRIFQSWTLTRGPFWPLLGMYVLVAALYVVVLLLGSTIIIALVMILGGGFHALEAVSNPDLANLAPGLWAAFAVYLLGNIVLAALQLAIAYAPQAFAYRELAGEGA
ncbi:hypothetical protein [Caulobacter sp. 17J65-9]|uniref:hypothetical protein n=1 Tax=Caulobacter sp. 17J65-9 TaxID=2709382 RepID=UPI0013C93557|nr:hypothetical protein [Caulobacter sp. 17J65-9]NEX94093.1 hypothetical protein [Caulobacter sp. 17J65-9]